MCEDTQDECVARRVGCTTRNGCEGNNKKVRSASASKARVFSNRAKHTQPSVVLILAQTATDEHQTDLSLIDCELSQECFVFFGS